MKQKEEKGIIRSRMRKSREEWKVVSVYGKEDWKNMELNLDKILGEERSEMIIIGGDFNLRIGELGGIDIEGSMLKRKSKDKTIGNGGRKFVEWIQEKGWYILNGRTKGDWEGEYTYVGARGNTIIDYVIVNEKVKDKIVEFKVGDRVDSDHLLLIVEIEEGRKRRGGKETERGKRRGSYRVE